ncbi:hypothetical protein AVEN_61939-1 [Araneus ventricosus]|uniref:Uncharacterized protein n=1 Tax=Araneus ventricosus TaxID=182803 RepID=A0A4Y2JFV8_ARAVE|nr:hypothetical protein AVEN_229342-1 [Araneus ventricosus]GBM88373.1 hypothetical protein AVEN_61939-1 [Araneus ventricosus]
MSYGKNELTVTGSLQSAPAVGSPKASRSKLRSLNLISTSCPFCIYFHPLLTGHVLLTPQPDPLSPSSTKNPFAEISSSCHWSKRQFSSQKVRERRRQFLEIPSRVGDGPIASRKMANI